MANQNSTHSIITFILFAALCVVGYLWYTGGSGNDQQSASGKTHGLLETETEFRDKLAELRMQKYKVENGIERLENLKSETVEHLNSKGIKSGEDYLKSDDADIKYAVVNLKGWVTQIAKIKKEVAYYDEAILGIEGMLDKIERDRIDESVSLSKDEYKELQKIILDLNERLSVETDMLEEEELGKLLDLEMTGTKK
jgi:hypothetical protein